MFALMSRIGPLIPVCTLPRSASRVHTKAHTGSQNLHASRHSCRLIQSQHSGYVRGNAGDSAQQTYDLGCVESNSFSNGWIGAHILTTGGHTELFDGNQEGDDGTWEVQDHNAQNEALKIIFAVHHSSLFIQSGLGHDERCFLRGGLSMGRKVAMCWSTRKSESPDRRCKQHVPAG